MNSIRKFIALGGLAAIACLFAFQPTQSQAMDPSYKGKTIRFVVGFGAGGGYDAYARMLAPRYQELLGATVVVENQPGAGGMVALNKFNVAPPNGLTLTVVNGTGASLQQLLGVKGARFDLTEFKILGTADYSVWNFLVSPNSPYNTLEDVMKAEKPFHWGSSGRVSGMGDGAAMTCFALNMKCKLVTGYKGSRAAALAVAKGEMDAMYVSETSAYNYVKGKNAKAVATMNRKRSILFPDLPTVFEQMPNLSKEQQWWIDYRATVESLGRILVMPPSTPDNLLKIMRQATHTILSDPKFVAEGAKKKRYIKYIDAAQTEKNIATVLKSLTPEQTAQIKKVVLEY
ncbi:MAG: tripartite tricarboxylate transporter substrate-binding protein [Proteobacteria bacterium]|nr:tripartite tricarboxylate transporter substrate-binding protein [Pseudomonadota bacterium]